MLILLRLQMFTIFIAKKKLSKDQADIFLAHDEADSELFNLFRAEHFMVKNLSEIQWFRESYQHLQKERKRSM